MGVVVSLNDLTLDELRKLSDRLTSIAVAGFRLEQDGLAPRFDLTPGQPMQIRLGVEMPAAFEASPPDLLKPTTTSTEAASPPADAQDDAVADLRQPVPVETPLAAGEVARGELVSAEPSRSDDEADPPKVAASSEAEAESGGGAVMAATIPPAAPVPGSASALAAKVANDWTEADDKTVIDTMVECVSGGMSKSKGLDAAAKRIGRTQNATGVRFYTALAPRFAAAMAAVTMVQAQTETPASDTTMVADGGAAAVGDAPAAVQTDDLTAHLLGMTDKGGWSLQRDTDLMELSIAGWPAGYIALELRMQASAIKPRFDALTGLHDDEATGKKVRRWTREKVLEALQLLAKARAA